MNEMDAGTFNNQLGKSLYGEIADATVSDDCTIMEGSRDRYISNCTFNKKLTLPVNNEHNVRFKDCTFEAELLIAEDSKINGVIRFEKCNFKKSFIVNKAEVAQLRFANCEIGGERKQLFSLVLRIDEKLTVSESSRSSEGKRLVLQAKKCEVSELAFGGQMGEKVSVEMDCERCFFKESVHLNKIRFRERLNFRACRFQKYVDCSYAHFSSISFRDSVFEQKAYFVGTCFGSCSDDWVADFSEVTFEDGADFERSIFCGGTTFLKAVFYEATTFTDIRFCNGSSEGKPVLGKDVLVFASAQIFGFVGFRKGANKKQEQTVLGNGQGGASDKACKCILPAEESLRVFEFESNEGLMVDFQNIYVQSSRGLRFHSANLEKCKVVGTNLDTCYFNDVRWARVRAHFPVYALLVMAWPMGGSVFSKSLRSLVCVLSWLYALTRGVALLFSTSEDEWKPPRKVFGIWDHVLLVRELETSIKVEAGSDKPQIKKQQWEDWKTQWTQISKAYRDLKIAYEQDKDYIYASDFHFCEKELRRVNPEVPWLTKVQLNLFWLINGYGERASRPVGWFLLFLVIGALVYHVDNKCITHPQPAAFSVSDVHATVRMPDKAIEGIPNPDSILSPVAPFQSPSFVILESARGEAKKDIGASGASSGSAGIRWVEAVGFSAATMAFLRPDFLVLKEGLSWARVMSWFQTIVGPALFGMFALAIRNKLKR